VADPESRASAQRNGQRQQAGGILDGLEWSGVNSFGDSAAMQRVQIKCGPARQ